MNGCIMNGFALRGTNHDNGLGTEKQKGMGALRRAFVVGEIA